MTNYYVSLLTNTNGEHEVHTGNCSQFPDFEDVLALGNFSHVDFAVREARKTFPQTLACERCLKVSDLVGAA